MKKFFTLCAAVLFAASVSAQEIIDLEDHLEDLEENAFWYLDGSIVTISPLNGNDAGEFIIRGASSTYTVKVDEGITADITLENVAILSETANPFIVEPGANVTITLVGENRLEVLTTATGKAALKVGAKTEGENLVVGEVTIQGNGSLIAYGGAGTGNSSDSENSYGGGAGIGTDSDNTKTGVTGGSITINGGYIVVAGGYNGAAIGGGYYGSITDITITGGVVVTTDRPEYGSRTSGTIGGASHGGFNSITISGGVVYCTWNLGRHVNNGGLRGIITGDPNFGNITISGDAIVFVGSDDSGDLYPGPNKDSNYAGGELYSAVIDEETGATKATTVSGNARLFVKISQLGTDPETGELTTASNIGAISGYSINKGSEEEPNEEDIAPITFVLNTNIDIPANSELTVPASVTIDGNGTTAIQNDGVIYANVDAASEPFVSGSSATSGAEYGVIKNLGEPTAIPTVTALGLSVYPSNGVIVVEGAALKSVSVISISGQTLISKAVSGTSATINASALPKGVYVVAVATANGTAVKKIVK